MVVVFVMVFHFLVMRLLICCVGVVRFEVELERRRKEWFAVEVVLSCVGGRGFLSIDVKVAEKSQRIDRKQLKFALLRLFFRVGGSKNSTMLQGAEGVLGWEQPSEACEERRT
jgi:hypothetical protein